MDITLLNVATAAAAISLSLFLVVERDLGVKGILLGTLLGTLLLLPPRIWATRSLLGLRISRTVMRKLLRFGLPLVPGAIALWAFALADRIILGRLSTFHELGLYTVATAVASLITVLFGPFGQAWSPHALEAYERDETQARFLYGRVLTVVLAGFGALGVAVTAFGPELLTVLAASEFRKASVALAPLALGAVAYASVQVTALPFSLKHRTGTMAIVTGIAAAFNIALNLAFASRYGMLAAAWATMASCLALTLLYVLVGRPLWAISYEKLRLLGLVVVVPFAILTATQLPDLSAPAAVVKVAYCMAFLVVAACLAFGGNPFRGGRLLPTLNCEGIVRVLVTGGSGFVGRARHLERLRLLTTSSRSVAPPRPKERRSGWSTTSPRRSTCRRFRELLTPSSTSHSRFATANSRRARRTSTRSTPRRRSGCSSMRARPEQLGSCMHRRAGSMRRAMRGSSRPTPSTHSTSTSRRSSWRKS